MFQMNLNRTGPCSYPPLVTSIVQFACGSMMLHLYNAFARRTHFRMQETYLSMLSASSVNCNARRRLQLRIVSTTSLEIRALWFCHDGAPAH
ncbi:hypothetical protein V1520DRAFT_290472 [Lipomyces starkeyi]